VFDPLLIRDFSGCCQTRRIDCDTEGKTTRSDQKGPMQWARLNNRGLRDTINMNLFIFLFMARPVTITTTLDPLMNNWLKEEAKRQKTTKRVIMERALLLYKTEEIRKKYIETYEKMNNDPETLELAEWGMKEYLEDLTGYENEQR
jgi:hypothetical protein